MTSDYKVIEANDPETLIDVTDDMRDSGWYPVGLIDSWSNERGDTIYKQAFRKD